MDADQVLSAFRSDGFAEIKLPTGIARNLLRLAEKLYAKPLSERLALAAFRTCGVLGYYPSELETIEIREHHNQIVPVFEGKRARGYSSYDYIANEQILAASNLFGANLWPVDKRFQIEACALYRLVAQFVKSVSQSILIELESFGKLNSLTPKAFDKECCSIMRLLKYTRCKGELESKAHTDYEFISLICADSQGLEVKSASGDWRIAPCNAGCAVIMPGDMLEVASSGWVQSALHRVRFGRENRLSTIFFQGLGLEQEIAYTGLDGRVVSTFERHLCGMLIRGAPHLQLELDSWERKLGAKIPERNPFRCNKDAS